jgi:hypothetical protein
VLAAQGAGLGGTKDAAGRLFLSPRTIDAYLRSIYAKLGIASRADLRNSGLGVTSDDHPGRSDRTQTPAQQTGCLTTDAW